MLSGQGAAGTAILNREEFMNYLIDTRSYSTFKPLPLELRYQPNRNYLFDLSYLAALSVKGENAADFLQGQLSCDIRAVAEESMRQGVLCNLKGRILAALDVLLTHQHQFSLVLPRDLSDDIQATLTKPAMFSRVQIAHESFRVFGLYMQNNHDLKPLGISSRLSRYTVTRHENLWSYHVGDGYYVLLVEPQQVDILIEPFLNADQYRGSLAWHAFQLQRLYVEIYPSSQGVFLPHRLNMHHTGYLSFDKGCYKGQEIIARMHYRSIQKYVLVCLKVVTDSDFSVGMSLYDERGQNIVAELIDYCPLGDNMFFIAVSVLNTYEGDFMSSVNNCLITRSLSP
jgi:folate-binding protein YgfZ